MPNTGIENVEKVGLVCQQCEAEVMRKADNPLSLPQACPVCDNPWNADEYLSVAYELIEQVRRLKRAQGHKVRLVISIR